MSRLATRKLSPWTWLFDFHVNCTIHFITTYLRMRFGIDRQTYGQPETWRFISFVGWESIPWEAIVIYPLAL